jgi:hypothetical protein
MSLTRELLVAEAERLVARSEREVKRNGAGQSEHARHARRKLERLRLYRSVLTSEQSANALMPEYVAARGLAGGVSRTVD